LKLELTSRELTRTYLLVLVISALVYIFTCAPGSLWQDSGMIQYRVWHNDIEGGLGLALAHPLFYLVAIAVKSIPLGEFGFRVNLVTAIFGAVTVANVYLFLRLVCGRWFEGAVGAITLGLSWTFWQHSAMAETYTLYTAIFTAELIFLYLYFKDQKIGFLYAVAFLNGLSVADHMFGSLALGCYLVLAVVLACRKALKVQQVLVLAVLWIIGCLPYEFLIVRELAVSGDLIGTVGSALFGRAYSGDVLNAGMSSAIVKQNFMFFGLSFPSPNILLFFAGLPAVYKIIKCRAFANTLIAMTAIYFVFAFRYTVPDRYAFFIPFYCLTSMVIGFGAGSFVDRFRNRFLPFVVIGMAFLAIPVYVVVPIVAERAGFSLGTKRQIPYRNEYSYFLRPWQRGNNQPERFVNETLNSLDENGIIIADGTTVYPLWYGQQVSGLRKDVKIVSGHGDYKSPIDVPTEETLDGLLAKGAVYVVSAQKGYCPKFILDNYGFIEAGPVFKIVRRVDE